MPKIINRVQIPSKPEKLLNVAAYARVSCEKDAMLHSLSAQVSYYSNMIQQHKDWKYAGVYADEAKTGTKESREKFQELLSECKAGNIDLIITKSISRFARNTVTLLSTVRALKELGVDVFFEEQNIHTLSNDGELMLTILASYAQEESLSASENMKWKIRKNFENGIASTFSLYGYEKVDGQIKIKNDEAEIVKEIFSLYLSGNGAAKIARLLRKQGIPSPTGAKWTATTIKGTLKNEKYCGDMLLQKFYTKDHLSKLTKRNKGVLPMYYVEGTHKGIVSKEDFLEVQRIFEERNKNTTTSDLDFDFKSIVFCGCCGWRYRRKKNYKKYVWRCGAYCIDGPEACSSKQIPDLILHQLADEIVGNISKIIILPDNNVKFILDDETEVIKHWVQPSRADSWTDEMKQEARRKSIEWSENNAKNN